MIGNDYYLDLILPQKIEIQKGLYVLGSKLGWILAGRTAETVENTAEPSMLILTYGTDINRETTLMTHTDYSLPLKPNLEDILRLESIGIQESPTESDGTKALNRFNETLSFEIDAIQLHGPGKRRNQTCPRIMD